MPAPHLLVVGAGSVGKRHLRNLAALGCRVSAVDPRADRLREAAGATPLAGAFADLPTALAAGRYEAAVVGTPTRFHVEQSIACLDRGLGVFLEKPVSMDAASAERLRDAAAAAGRPVLVGYTYRWWPPLVELRRRVLAGDVGRVLYVRAAMAAHLADWHPWEPVADFFMSSAALGGGALLDESHVLDLLHWVVGPPARVIASVAKVGPVEMDADDCVDATLFYGGSGAVAEGARASVHLDLFSRPHERAVTVVGETGTLHWTFDPNRLRLGRAGGGDWEDVTYTCDRNEMFVAAARHFLEVLAGREAPACTLDDGVAVMRVVEAIRASSAAGRVVDLP
ncbi:MAG TPA: Gfo/Idh/MocA family oxidoreductase [Humisphaera sp.]